MATVAQSDRTTIVTLASAIAGPFDLTFRLFDDDGLSVFVNSLPRTDFTISSTYVDGYDDDATITFNAPLSIDDVVIIDSDLSPSRAQDYLNGPGLVEKQNVEFARIWSVLQDLRRGVGRSVKSFTSLSPITLIAGRLLIVNSAGTSIEMGPEADDIAGAQGYAASAATDAGTATTKAGEAAVSAAAALVSEGNTANKQPLNTGLTSIATLATAAGKFLYTTAESVWAEGAITAAGRALLDDADAATQLVTLGAAPLAGGALSGGITSSVDDDGTKSSGTYTPTITDENFKKIVGNGAFTLAAPTDATGYSLAILITNGASAGTVTFSGFEAVTGDTVSTTNGEDFMLYITSISSFAHAHVVALQ